MGKLLIRNNCSEIIQVIAVYLCKKNSFQVYNLYLYQITVIVTRILCNCCRYTVLSVPSQNFASQGCKIIVIRRFSVACKRTFDPLRGQFHLKCQSSKRRRPQLEQAELAQQPRQNFKSRGLKIENQRNFLPPIRISNPGLVV